MNRYRRDKTMYCKAVLISLMQNILYWMNSHYTLERTEMLRVVRVSDANFQLRFVGTGYYPRCSTVKLEKNSPYAVPWMNAAL